MSMEWNYSYFGIGCIVWTMLLGFTSFIFIRFRQRKLLQKIEVKSTETETKLDLVDKNVEMEKCSKDQTDEELSNGGEEKSEDDETPPIISSDDILLETQQSTEETDPFEYIEHIQGEVKRIEQKVTQKKFIGDLTSTQMVEEREVRRKQMEAIFKLMEEKNGEFGLTSMEDMQRQMKLYM